MPAFAYNSISHPILISIIAGIKGGVSPLEQRRKLQQTAKVLPLFKTNTGLNL
jgi:hypothetical protein